MSESTVPFLLNVGGMAFYTSRETLSKGSHFFSSMMRAIDSDTHDAFVDRDPVHFRHVLNWLRGSRHVPDDADVLRELFVEADFYCLSELKQRIAERMGRMSLPSVATSLDRIVTLLKPA